METLPPSRRQTRAEIIVVVILTIKQGKDFRTGEKKMKFLGEQHFRVSHIWFSLTFLGKMLE